MSVGHPLIHLGYAYEVDSKEVAIEALAMVSVKYDFLHKYLDDSSYTKPSPLKSKAPLDLLIQLSKDDRFSKEEIQVNDMKKFLEEHESPFLEYWNGWDIDDDPKKQFELSQEAAVALLVATVQPGSHAYNFFIVHLLTTSHAVRVLLPFLPPQHHVTLVREWWLFVLAVFTTRGRPLPDPDNVESDLKGKSWKYVEDKALNSAWSKDAHYVKGMSTPGDATTRYGEINNWILTLMYTAVRAIRDAARTWGDVHERYLQAAVTFVDNFHGWVF
jgi:hypothetical protein